MSSTGPFAALVMLVRGPKASVAIPYYLSIDYDCVGGLRRGHDAVQM